MSSYILIGSDVSLYNTEQEIKNSASKVFGDGKDKIDCNSLKFEDNSNVKILSHGNRIDLNDFSSLLPASTLEPFAKIGMNYIHTLSLCESESILPSFMGLSTISNSKVTNFVLSSCYGGTVINDIYLLPKWSTLITLNSPDQELLGALGQEILIKSKDFDYQANPFIQLAFYIYNNPDSTQFAIRHRSGVEIFKSFIDDFINEPKQNFSQEEIRKWQNVKLQNFIDFCKEIQGKMNVMHSKNIQEFLKFVENKNDLLEQSGLDRYQELLLVNIISRNEFDLIDTPENVNIVRDVVFVNNISTFFWAIKENNIVFLAKLIESGVDVNSLADNGLSGLHYSIILEYISIDVIKLLMESGADINIKNLDDFTALEAASHHNNLGAVLELLKVGAVSDELESNGYILDSIGSAILFGLSSLSKVINNEYFTDFIKIAEEEELFMNDPIEYILIHNDQVDLSLNAMDNLILQEYLVELHPQILKTKDCLGQLPDTVNGDLNILCGRDHFTCEL